MKCSKVRKKLSAYIDDALSPAEKNIIAKHLRSCPKCRKTLSDTEMTISTIKGLEEIIPPSWLTQKIMTKVKSEAKGDKNSLLRKLFYPLHIKLPIEAVGIFLVAITALYVFRTMGPELKTSLPLSEEKAPKYVEKEKSGNPRQITKKESHISGKISSNKDETAPGPASPRESGRLYESLEGKNGFNERPHINEKYSEEPKTPEMNMSVKSSPSPSVLPNGELKQESMLQKAGKTVSGFSEKEDISLSFKAADMVSVKKNIKDILSGLGGRAVKAESSSESIFILTELSSDKLSPLMQKLKTLGYVKEKMPTPMSEKDHVLIKITVSRP